MGDSQFVRPARSSSHASNHAHSNLLPARKDSISYSNVPSTYQRPVPDTWSLASQNLTRQGQIANQSWKQSISSLHSQPPFQNPEQPDPYQRCYVKAKVKNLQIF